MVQDDLSKRFDGFTVVGRSGGYWGISDDSIENYVKPKVDYDKIYRSILPEIKKYIKSKEFKDAVKERQSHKILLEDFIEENLDPDIVRQYTTFEPTNKLQKLGKEINQIIKDYEKADTWVDIIMQRY